MDRDEVIDTSDPEEYAQELEERRKKKLMATTQSSIYGFDVHYSDHGPFPPKKKTKYHHNHDDEEKSPLKSESMCTSSPRRSPSFSTTFATTSPGPLFTSRSPTRTPGHTRVLHITKSEEEDFFFDLFTPPPEDSQDPLLLISPTRPPLSTPRRQRVLPVDSPRQSSFGNTPNTYTPVESPPGPRSRVPPISPSPLPPVKVSLSRTPLAVRDNDLSLNSPPKAAENKDNDYLLFTPAKANNKPICPSPLRLAILDPPNPSSPDVDPRERSQSRSPTPSFSMNSSLVPQMQTTTEAPVVQDDDSVALAQSLADRSRYSLRQRKPAQLKPYTSESIMYKHQLRSVPEAIFKTKALDHIHRDPTNRYEDDVGTQQDGYVDDGTQADDNPWEEMEQRRKRRRDVSQEASTSGQQRHYPGILQGFSFSDDDEDEAMQDTAREAHKYKKRMEKEKKAQEQEQRERKRLEEETRKAKPFPLLKGDFILYKPKKVVSTSESEENRPAARQSSGVPDHIAALHGYFQDDYDISDREHQGDYNDNSHHEPQHLSSLPPDSILRNSYEDAILVNSDEEEDQMQSAGEPERANSRSHSVAPGSDIILDLEPKKKTILHKMMPAFMINRLAQESTESARQRQRRQQENRRSSMDPDDLLPGQSRVQISTNLRPIHEIKGDSESEVDIDISSDSDSSSDSQVDIKGTEVEDGSDSDVNDILFVYQRPNTQKSHNPHVIDLTHDNFSDSDGTPPALANAHRYKPRRKGGAERLRDPSAIDYMLARSGKSERNGSSLRGSTSTSHRKRSIFTHDIVTGGGRKYGRERQTLLSFPIDNKHHHKSSKRSSGKQPKASTSRHGSVDEDLSDDVGNVSDHQVNRVLPVDKPTRKQRKKMKEKRVKELGVYTFRSDAQGITSGRRPGPVYITVDLEDDGFHRTLEPKVSGPSPMIDWSRQYQPPLVIRKLKPLGSQVAPEEASSSRKRTSKAENASDLGIPVLHPGKSFAASTYIKKGWLYELINVNQSNQSAPMIADTKILGFHFNVTMGVEELCSMLPKFSDELFDFATGLPDPDIDVTTMQWSSAMRMVCQLTSWYLKDAISEEAVVLVNTVQTQFARLVTRIETASISFIEAPVLSVVWFVVELSARVRQGPKSSSGRELKKLSEDSSSLLMRLLLQYSLNQTMQPFLDEVDLDETSLAHYSAELWVRLIHLLGSPLYETTNPQSHRFWTQLKEVLIARAGLKNTRTPYEASEDAWLTIYSVCALSQFSVHGMTVGHPHLPTYWDIVIFALRRINLNPNFDKVAETLRRKYDKYVALIVNRCFHLWDRYKWNLGDPMAIQVFNELLPIFTSRKHANLLHEKDEYPAFFRDANWDRLSLNYNETAYTLFVKLIVQAIQDGKLSATGQTSVKFGKLMRLLIPMGDLSFTEPRGQELTMFYNRMAALAIASDLDRNSLNDRVEKARSYLNFAKVNYQSRSVIIRGMANWGCLLVQRRMNIGAFADWIEEMAQILIKEFITCTSPDAPISQPTRRLQMSTLEGLMCSLLIAVRNIIESCAEHTCYPEPSFLKSLKPVYNNHKAMNFNAQKSLMSKQFVLLMNAYLDARSKALPPPPRPPLSAPSLPAVEEDSQESQDYGSMDAYLDDFDWTHTDLPEALITSSNASTKHTDNEKHFRDVLASLQTLKWVTLAGLRPFLIQARKGDNYLCDLWLRAWLGLSAIDPTKTSWEETYKRIDDELGKCHDEQWSRRVQLSVMFQTLRLNPMQYMDFIDRAFGVFLNALVSDTTVLYADKADDPTVERAYVSLVLSIDGRHPLLLNATLLPAKDDISSDYELTGEQFLTLRIPLLQGIFKNLNELIRQGRIGMPEVPLDVQRYIILCREMLSAMRNNLTKIPEGSDQRTEYRKLCFEIIAVLKGNRELCEMESMRFWATWCPP